MQSFFWDEGDIRSRMEDKLLSNLDAVMGAAVRTSCDLRTAAYTIAVQRIVDSARVRGFYP